MRSPKIDWSTVSPAISAGAMVVFVYIVAQKFYFRIPEKIEEVQDCQDKIEEKINNSQSSTETLSSDVENITESLSNVSADVQENTESIEKLESQLSAFLRNKDKMSITGAYLVEKVMRGSSDSANRSTENILGRTESVTNRLIETCDSQ